MRLHLVSNSHIDPVWLWDKYEGIDEVLNTFRSACDRLDEFPELCFSASSIQFYKWCHDYDPGLFDRVKEKVREGRWEITGGWWIEPDSNLPLEISVKMQQAVSQRFLDEHFEGRRVEVAFLPDTFGHPATLPKLLSEMGQKYFVFCRPGEHEKDDLPGNLFYWEYAGHRVLAYRLKHHYTQPKPTDEAVAAERVNDAEYREQPVNAFFFGVGDHGGGPTIGEIKLYQKLMADRLPGDMGFSTCEAFFKEAEKMADIPTYSGDLHRHAVGCYSVMRDLKDQIRRSERGLAFAARTMALNNTSDDTLTPLWHRTLFNQFHDILPGSSSPDAADMARAEMGGVADGWRTRAYEMLKSVSAARPVRCHEGEFRVFNTLPYEITAPVAIESFQYFVEGADFQDASGKSVALQEVLPSVRCNNRRWMFVDTFPPRGFNTYHFHGEGIEAARRPSPAHFVEGDRVCNARFEVAASGAISRVGGSELMPGPQFRVLDDGSDTWGHGVVRYDDFTGVFEQQAANVLVGEVTQKLFQRWTYGRSHIDAVYSLYRGMPWVDLDVTVNWAEDRRILKLELAPGDADADTFLMQGPGGAIERLCDGAEQPLHHWAVLGGNRDAFSVIQDGAFAGDCLGGKLRITLVRSSFYGYHDPYVLDVHDPQHLTDQGLHDFRFRFFFDETIDAASMDRRADVFLEPFWVIRESGGQTG